MEYDLQQFITKNKDKDWHILIVEIPKELRHLDEKYSKLKRNEYDNGLTNYRKHVGDFLFFLNNGIVPAGIGIEGLKNFLPIVEKLVAKNQLIPKVLDLFRQ